MSSSSQEADRQSGAAPDAESPQKPDSPTDLTATSWKYVLRKTMREFLGDGCTDLAAALTYYSILAFFPAMVALLAVMGLFSDPQRTVDAVLEVLGPLVSSGVIDSVRPVLEGLASSQAAGVALVLGLLAALFSASNYVGAFGRALNTIYDVEEGRPIWKLRPIQFALTLVSVLLAATALALLILSGPVLTSVGGALGIGDTAVTVFAIAKWPLLLLVVVVLVGLLYHVSPNVQQPKFRWISVGAATAIGTWIVASAGFGFYVANFSNYSATYGSLAGLVIALLYVWLTNLALLFGAELDAELERGRQLQAGIPAEENLQLPPRDTTQIKKTRATRDKDAALGRRIRRAAVRPDTQDHDTKESS